MPAKSIVLLEDSPYLNPTEFRQESGRAGRRGFDNIGHVIFYGISTGKISQLMSSAMPKVI